MAYQIEIHGLRATVASGGQLVVTGEAAALTPAEAQAFAKLLKTLAGLAPGLYVTGATAKAPEAVKAPAPVKAEESSVAAAPAPAAEAAPASAAEPAPAVQAAVAAPAAAAVSNAAPATTTAAVKPADGLPGRPRSIPRSSAAPGVAAEAPSKVKAPVPAAAKEESTAAAVSDGRPGRPRSIPRVSVAAEGHAAPAAKAIVAKAAPAAAAQVVAASDDLPGRPRSTPRISTASDADSAAAQAKRGPGRPRRERADPNYVGPIVSFVTTLAPERKRGGRPKGSKNKVKSTDAAPASTAVAAPSAPASSPAGSPATEEAAPKPVKATGTKGPRLIDLYDAWMREHPGMHGRLELIKVGVENGWLSPDDAARSFGISMSRERVLFHHDKVTDQWVRRVELKAPVKPGRLDRRAAKK